MIDNIIDCTVVVSNLPEGADMMQLMKLFKRYGVRKVTMRNKAEEERQPHALVELNSEKAVADAVAEFGDGKPRNFSMAYGETIEQVLSVKSKRETI